MTNVLSLVGILIKLIPFLKEVFLKNDDFKKAITNNKALIGIFLACVIMFVSNVSQFDRLVTNSQQIRKLSRGISEIETEYAVVREEITELRSCVKTRQEQNHKYEIELSEMKAIIRLREERMEEMKATISKLRSK